MYPTMIVVLVCLGISQKDKMDRLGRHTITSSMAFAPASGSLTRTSYPPRALSDGRSTNASHGQHRTIEIRVEELPTYTRSDVEFALQDIKHDDSTHKLKGVGEDAESQSENGR